MKSTQHSRSQFLRAFLVAFVALSSTALVSAGTVGGSVTPINSLSSTTFTSNITIGSSTPGSSNAQTDTTIVTGQIDNNNENGWKLKVDSGNLGILKRGTGGAGQEIAYNTVKFVKVTGTLGAGLTDPDGGVHNIATGASYGAVAGTTYFNTGDAYASVGTATTATVGYQFGLKISWSNDNTLLAGSYTDAITLTLSNDS
jgi:hypothetical protein